MKNFLTAALFLLLIQFSYAQCPSGQVRLRLEINPDQYFNEVTWIITNSDASGVYAMGGCNNSFLQTFNYCLPADECIVFRIMDDYGDGIEPDGFYRIFLDSVLVFENLTGNYGDEEVHNFNCPVGSTCSNPFPAALGSDTTETDQQSWYEFTPPDTGTYKISTCGLGNSCATKIWVYDKCQGIFLSDNQLGATFFSDSGCDDGAEATLYLAGGQTYYIRLKYTNGACAGLPIHFNFTYEGPVSGCTDPAACNYNPLATQSDTCVYPGSPDCTGGPDLVVDGDLVKNTMTLDLMPNSDQCAVEEGCLRGIGNRYVINFSTRISNIGSQDYFIGGPPSSVSVPSTQFVYDPCHLHWHYRGYADYILFDSEGNQLPIGSKNGFCVLDLECLGGGTGKYTCGNMGITAGCGDVYDTGLPCQWIDVTDLPAGRYSFVVRVNWDKSPDKLGRVELSYENNWAQVCFELTYTDGIPEMEIVDECEVYTDCNGVLLGDAKLDCKGVCGGSALQGDWDENAQRNANDVQSYLNAAMSDPNTVSNCNDLYADSRINVYDAALLQECNLHADEVAHWGSRFPCTFPTGVENIKDIVYLLPGTLDTVAKTFDVEIVNPFYKILGYQFSVSGLEIESVENTVTGYNVDLRFGASGQVMGLSLDESLLKKNILATSFLRIHYKKLTSHQVCISEIVAVVNEKYHLSEASIASPSCVGTGLVGANNIENNNGFGVFASPNPFKENTNLFIQNPNGDPVTLTLSDMTGRVVRSYSNIQTEQFTLSSEGLPKGVYVFTAKSNSGIVSGKLMKQ